MHADRVDAVARRFPECECIGIEVYSRSLSYSWDSETRESFKKITLCANENRVGVLQRLWKLIQMRFSLSRAVWFLCHYERPEIFLFAVWLRLTGAKVYTMGCSKFDDMPRTALREFFKSVFLRPYHGAIGSPDRSCEYFHFLGMRKRPIVGRYNTLSATRMRQQADVESIHESDILFANRPWVIVARLVPKKNLSMALDAYSSYRANGGKRRLLICGDGPMENELRQQTNALKLVENVEFRGFLQSTEVSKTLGKAIALVLPSIEEQFGNVVIEAQALALPVLLSTVCGARDRLVRNWKNGFVFEPDNPEGLAQFMLLLDNDQALWTRLSKGAAETAPLGDVSAFADAVGTLIAGPE